MPRNRQGTLDGHVVPHKKRTGTSEERVAAEHAKRACSSRPGEFSNDEDEPSGADAAEGGDLAVLSQCSNVSEMEAAEAGSHSDLYLSAQNPVLVLNREVAARQKKKNLNDRVYGQVRSHPPIQETKLILWAPCNSTLKLNPKP